MKIVFYCRSRLAKAKIDAGTENEKKDDSGNETGAGEADPEEDPDVVHYDKSKSFFDNISCEAVERSKGSVQTLNIIHNKFFAIDLQNDCQKTRSVRIFYFI